MTKGWLEKTIGGHRIDHVECPHPGLVNEDAPPAGVMHTIEGSLESGLAVFHQHYAPHFTLDSRRIVQLVPLGYMAAALENRLGGVETNSVVRAQIELAGNSREKPWLPDNGALNLLADLLATLQLAAGIPLHRPYPDAMPPPPWATTSFTRRRDGKWGKVDGWYGHVEVPENEHWDPGALRWSVLLEEAEKIAAADVPAPKPVPHPTPAKQPRHVPAWFWLWLAWRLGEKHPDKDFRGHALDPAWRPASAPARIPDWAWAKASAYIAARREAA